MSASIETPSDMKPAKAPDTRGLAGQTAGDTSICSVNQTQLIYRGYEIADLAENATFEEVAWLLYHGEKPTAEQAKAFHAELAGMRDVPASVAEMVTVGGQGESLDPSHVACCGRASRCSRISTPSARTTRPRRRCGRAKRLLAKIPTLIGVCQAALDGRSLPANDPSLSHAAYLMLMLTGKKPSELAARIMDVSLILYAEHDFNASTFTCRVIASTESDLHSAICGGIGALKGQLHGGANEMAMEMLKEIDVDTAKSGQSSRRLDACGLHEQAAS